MGKLKHFLQKGTTNFDVFSDDALNDEILFIPAKVHAYEPKLYLKNIIHSASRFPNNLNINYMVMTATSKNN